MKQKGKIIIDDPYSVLRSLRWRADMKVFSPDEPGVLIWLKQMPAKEGIMEGHGYLTECCYADDPCENHKQIENNINNSLKN